MTEGPDPTEIDVGDDLFVTYDDGRGARRRETEVRGVSHTLAGGGSVARVEIEAVAIEPGPVARLTFHADVRDERAPLYVDDEHGARYEVVAAGRRGRGERPERRI